MDRSQQFRNWMYKNSEEYGRMTSEYDYMSYSKGWDHALQEVRRFIEEIKYVSVEDIDKHLDKL